MREGKREFEKKTKKQKPISRRMATALASVPRLNVILRINVVGSVPSQEAYMSQPIDVSLSHIDLFLFLSPSPFLSL